MVSFGLVDCGSVSCGSVSCGLVSCGLVNFCFVGFGLVDSWDFGAVIPVGEIVTFPLIMSFFTCIISNYGV